MRKEIINASLIAILLIVVQSMIFFMTKLIDLNVIILGSSIDSKIPFISQFVYFYYLWYVFLFFIPFSLYFKDKKVLKKYIFMTSISCVLLGITYIVYPTGMIRESFNVRNLSTFLVDFIYKMDMPVRNCFPSAHCLYSFIFMACIYNAQKIDKRIRLCVIFSSFLIVLATMFIKQHVFIDVVGALIYFIIVLVIYNIYIRRVNKSN